jgi:hypothetical protein
MAQVFCLLRGFFGALGFFGFAGAIGEAGMADPVAGALV